MKCVAPRRGGFFCARWGLSFGSAEASSSASRRCIIIAIGGSSGENSEARRRASSPVIAPSSAKRAAAFVRPVMRLLSIVSSSNGGGIGPRSRRRQRRRPSARNVARKCRGSVDIAHHRISGSFMPARRRRGGARAERLYARLREVTRVCVECAAPRAASTAGRRAIMAEQKISPSRQ